MLIKPMRFAGALLATCVLGGQLSAQDASITDYNPKTITTGTVITIQGDFAAKTTGKIPKPKVFGTMGDAKGKVTFKVLSNTETEIMAEVKKIPTNKKNPAAGTNWTLNVQPKGKGAFGATTSASLMTVVGPVVTGVNPSTAMPGEEITVSIANAGKKPPKMKIGGKKAKLKPVTITEGGGGSSFTSKVPKSLANGSWDVDIDNKIGQDTAKGALTVTGSTKKIGKAVFTATLDFAGANSLAYKSSGKLLIGTDAGTAVTVNANLKQNNPQRSFTIVIPFNTSTDMVPQKYVGFPTTLLTFVYTETTLNGQTPTVLAWQPASPTDISVTVNAVSGGQMAGFFSGMLISAGQPDLAVEGEFVVDLKPTP
jgi:hypothetical protein